MDVGGARVHYLDEGGGPVLLLLHGNPTWSFLYRGLVHRLAGSFRCVAPDHPGFGLSAAPDGYGHTAAEHTDVLTALVEALDLRDVVLVAHDWGGPIGVAAAARRPGRYRGLVVANTWAWRPRTIRLRAFSRVVGGSVGGWAVRRGNLLAGVVLPSLMTRRRLTALERRHYTAPFPDSASRRPTHVLARELTTGGALLDEAARGVAALADLPGLVVWGQRDPALGTVQRRRWEDGLPRHETVLLRGAGHLPQEDAPDEMAAALGDWHGARWSPGG